MITKIIFLLLFFGTMIGVGLYSRKSTTSVDGFVLGGRSVGPWLTAFAYGTSYFSAVVFVGYAGQFGWKYGLASTWIGLGNAAIGSLLASKLWGLRSVAVVTDIYDQMVGQRTRGFKTVIKKLAGILNKKYVGLFDRYILLTEDMNAIVNPKKRPFIVMEALCDEKLSDVVWESADKSFPKVIMYAGGLEEKYGLKMLVQAFRTISDDNIELHLYGSGSYVEELVDETKEDRRIKFWGVKSNEEIMDAESKATLLVNPRFTTEEFTRYSFPSKNMEYMVSGTPVLTTKLPGMPSEYYPYVYLIEDESVDGFALAMSSILQLPSDILQRKGLAARNFVLREKNNIRQGGRIMNLIIE